MDYMQTGVSFPRPFGLRAYVVARRAGRRPSPQLLLQPVAVCRGVGGGAVVVRAAQRHTPKRPMHD